MIVIWGSRKSRATFEGDLRSGVVRPNLTHFVRFSGSKSGSNRVGLTSKRVQIRVHSYNVLNKPDMNLTQPVFGSGWALMVQNRVEFSRIGPLGQNVGQIQGGFGQEV